jgi:putative dehydrogenase
MTSIGIIGLGLMGTAMAERLIEAGHGVVGHDLDPARCEALQKAGASIAASARDVSEQCRTLIIAVYNAAQIETTVENIANGAGDSRPVLICTTTCSPEEILGIAGRAAASGFGFVEAPISGTSAEVRTGAAACLMAGDPVTIASVRSVIDTLCPRAVLAGNVGDASRTKLAINLILQANRAALAEGIVFADRMGLDGSAFLRAAQASAAYSSVMDTKGDKMLTRDYRPQSRISQTLKDAELILAEAARHSLELPMTTTQATLLRKAIQITGGDSDSSAVIEAIRQQTGEKDTR